MQGRRKRFAALDIQEQIVLALFDLGLHGGSAVVDRINQRSPRLQDLLKGTRQLEEVMSMVNAKLHLSLSSQDEGAVLTLKPKHPLPTSERKAWHMDSTALLHRLQNDFSFTPSVEGTAFNGGFSHLCTYGGGYYSYL